MHKLAMVVLYLNYFIMKNYTKQQQAQLKTVYVYFDMRVECFSHFKFHLA